MALQPYRVFRDEMTRLNLLYWTSSYSYSRLGAVLGALAAEGQNDPDPRVDRIWPSIRSSENKHITVPISKFRNRMDLLLEGLRTTSILHICSAFENCMASYFVLALLYQPTAIQVLSEHQPVPSVMRDPAAFDALRSAACNRVRSMMKGTYQKRLNKFLCFGVPAISDDRATRLDEYYEIRNVIAHDQSLRLTDDPHFSATEILASRLAIDESQWKQMLADFGDTVARLDDELSRLVVRDEGLVIAVHRIATRTSGSISLSEVIGTLRTEWGLDSRGLRDRARQALIDAGFRVQRRHGRDESVSIQ